MSTPAPPQASNSLRPVRQQLEELDGLLQRMLELPVEPALEDSPLPRSDVERTERAGNPVISESSRLELDSAKGEDPSFANFQFPLSNHRPETAAENGFLNSGKDWAGDAGRSGEPSRTPKGGLAKSPVGLAGPTLPRSIPANEEWEQISVGLWPLVALNQVVDRCLGRLGWFGRWWQGTWGRPCLGLIGLLLLGGALAWAVLDWMQWTW